MTQLDEKISTSKTSMARDILGLNLDHSFEIDQEKKDELNMTHIRCNQIYKDIPVHASQIIMHMKGESIASINGHLARNFNQDASITISGNDAIGIAKKIIPSTIMAHDHPAFDGMSPTAELIWHPVSDQGANATFTIAYKVDIYSLKPHYRYDYFIDAQTGAVIGRTNQLVHETVPRSSETVYYGEREILVDSIGPQMFLLEDTHRKVKTTTIDIDRLNEEDIYNGDSTWTTDNYIYGELDAHWGAEKTYDYFLNILNRNSVDDNGHRMDCKIIREFGVQNAFWNGSFSVFGAGNGGSAGPFSVLDVVGHEFTHGMVDYTADLIYQGESGALNESFADIFGKGVEHYTVPDEFSWELGRGIRGPERGIRNMQDPKIHSNPNYYRGEFWQNTSADADNGGVHSNSGVQNYWFYLITEGEAGINERGFAYNVPAIGFAKAEQIAYRNLAYYLFPSSSYADAVKGSIQAAIDLYGGCSPEHLAVTEAWRAVGLWNRGTDENFYQVDEILGVETACGLSEVSISAMISRLHCNTPIEPSVIEVTVIVDDTIQMIENINVDGLSNYGDVIPVQFSNLVDISEIGYHSIDVIIKPDNQNVSYDSLRFTFENKLQQNADFITMDAKGILSSCDLNGASITGIFMFNGCDSINAGESIDISYILNEDESTRMTETYILPSKLFPGEYLEYSFTSLSNLEMEGPYDISMDIDYTTDPFIENNVKKVAHIYHTRSIDSKEQFKFLKPDVVDEEYSYLKIGNESTWEVVNGRRHLLLSGGEAFDRATGQFTPTFPTSEEDMWSNNPGYKNQYCFCIDAQNWPGGAMISFDHVVARSSFYDSIEFAQPMIELASALRMIANNSEQVMPTIFGHTIDVDTTLMYSRDTVLLENYGGQYFDLCFESHHFLNPSRRYGSDPDGVHLDNIVIEEYLISATDEINRISQLIELYPNPTSDYLNISIPKDIIINKLNIISADGKTIQMHINILDDSTVINTAALPSGYYILQLQTNENIEINKSFVRID